MRNAQQGGSPAERRKSPCGAAVQLQLRWSAAPDDFDVAPEDALGMAGAERLHRRFVWVQAGGGPALACRSLSPVAHHLYTTRRWLLGSGSAADGAAWAPVAAAVDIDVSRLLRVRQVHGASVVVHRAGSALAASRA